MTELGNRALDVFWEAVKEQVKNTIENADKEALGKAADLIQESVKNGGRIHVTGIGKLHMAYSNGRLCGAKRPKCEAERSPHL